MAQVGHYPIEHQSHSHRNRRGLEQESSPPQTSSDLHPLSVGVPQPPGPELESQLVLSDHNLPEPPRFSNPDDLISTQLSRPAPQAPFEEHRNSLSSQALSGPVSNTDLTDTVPPTTVDFLASAAAQEIASSELDRSNQLLQVSTNTSTSEVEEVLVPALEQEADLIPPLSQESGSAPPTEEHSVPLVFAEGEEKKDILPNTSEESADRPVEQDKWEGERVASVPLVEEKETFPGFSTEEKPATWVADSMSSQQDGQNARLAAEGDGDLKPQVVKKLGETAMNVEDWTDLNRAEVRIALSLFAIPWSSAVITSRTVNHLWFLIFDWYIVKPSSGLLPTIIGPSMVYGSLIALIVYLAANVKA